MITSKVPPIFLFVGNKKYLGFSSLRFTKELTGVAHGFALEMTDVNALEKIQNGLTNDVLAQVYLGPTLLTTGYIDSVETDSSLKLRVNGRSKASRLIDCSAKKKEYKNVTIQTLANLLCQKYSILFADETGIAKQRTIKSEAGDSPLSLMKKWLEESNDVWLSSLATGDLVLKPKPKRSLAQFIYGENVYRYSILYDFQDVFSDYTVYSSAHDALLGKTSFKGTYQDDYLKTYKNKSFEAAAVKDKAGCIAKAKKAAIAAKSRMMTLSMDVPVYLPSGMMVDAGDLVTVTLPHHSVENHEFIVNRLSLEVSSSSFKMNLELIDASAFNSALKGSDVLFTFDGAFAKAFHAARTKGLKSFLLRGRRYHTRILEEIGLSGGLS